MEQISDTGKVNTNQLKRLILTFFTEVGSVSTATVRTHRVESSLTSFADSSLQSACFVFVSRIPVMVGGGCYLTLERQILSVQHHQAICYASPTVNVEADYIASVWIQVAPEMG